MKKGPSSSSNSSSSSTCTNQSIQPKINKKKKKPRAKNADTTSLAKRSSIYRGVTKHRWTGRFEAHLWDKTTWNNLQNKRGRQIYLGAYDNEEVAAHTYDLAALKYWGPSTTLNFPAETYQKEMEEMQKLSREEYLASLRRKSSGFSRGVSKYRGVARHHHNGRWEARIGRVRGNKYLYLGTYGTQEEAAAAYDMAAIEYRGANAVTNFDMSKYADLLKKVLAQRAHTPEQTEPQAATANNPNHHQVGGENSEEFKEHEQDMQPQTVEFLTSMDLNKPVEWNNSNNEYEYEYKYEDDNSWNLCLDTTAFNTLEVPELPLEKSGEFENLLNDTGFEDYLNIYFDGASSVENDLIDLDMLLDEPLSVKNELSHEEEGALETIECGSVEATTTKLVAKEEKKSEGVAVAVAVAVPHSPSSSAASCSTTTSAFIN